MSETHVDQREDVLEALKQVKYLVFAAISLSFGIVRDIGWAASGRPSPCRPPADAPNLVDQIGDEIARVVADCPEPAADHVTAPRPSREASADADTRGRRGSRGAQHHRGRQRQGRRRQVDGRGQPRPGACRAWPCRAARADVWAEHPGHAQLRTKPHHPGPAHRRSRRTACARSRWASSSSATAP